MMRTVCLAGDRQVRRGRHVRLAPGTAYRYNNTGYVLLGMVIEKASGKKYAKYLDAQFFKPLGLRQMSCCPSKTSNPAFALGNSKGPSRTVRAKFMDLSHPFAAGAVCSTVGDFAKWQRALDGGKVVSPASYTLMSTADTLNSGRKINYGFGLVPGVFNGHTTVSHTGGIPGFATAETYVPDDSLSIVIFTNFDGESPQALVQNLLRVAYRVAPVGRGGSATQAGTPSPSAADRDAIVGTYTLQLPGGQSLPIKFFLDGTRLMAQARVRMRMRFGNGDWKRRVERATTKAGRPALSIRRFHSLFPLALSTRSFHSLFPLAVSTRTF